MKSLAQAVWSAAAFDGAITAVAFGVLLAAGFPPSPLLLCDVALGVILIHCAGLALAPRLLVPQGRSHSSSFVVGFVGFSMALMLIVLAFSITALHAFLCCLPVLALLCFYRRPAASPIAAQGLFEPVTVLMFGTATAWFCRSQIQAYATLLQTGVFHPWDDFFVHGAQLAQFGDPVAGQHGDILAVGQHLAFYHYGMFMIPATLLAYPGGLPGVAIASSALLVWGLLVAVLGCYALADELSGQLAALLAVAAVMVLPDAAATWPQNGFFGFHWLLMIAPGSAYAIGASAVALLFLVRWQKRTDWRNLAACALLVAATALLRAQIFVVLAPAALLVVCATWWSIRTRYILMAFVACALLLLLACLVSHPFQNWFESRTRFTEFIGFIYTKQVPNLLASRYVDLTTVVGAVAASWLGLLALPVVILGPWSVLYPATMVFLRSKKWLTPHDAIPLLLILVYLAVVVFAPTPSNADFTEFKQRPFVLVYALLLLWPIARLVGSMQSRSSSARTARRSKAIAVCCVIALFGAIAVFFEGYDPQDDSAGWTRNFTNSHPSAGLAQASVFIRAHSQPGDVMTVVGGCANQSVALASMTGVPQYFAQGGVQWSRRGETGQASTDPHLFVIAALENGKSAGDVVPILKQAGIHWLVVIEPEPGCDKRAALVGTPDFRAQRVAVFSAAR